jgi:hypothetical protein
MRLNPYYPDTYLWHLADAYSYMGVTRMSIATIKRMRNPPRVAGCWRRAMRI